MARLMHLWYLVQQGYSSALFVPLSEYINKSRKGYYDAYTLVEENARISGMLDATPFLVYFIEHVYHKLNEALPAAQTTAVFQEACPTGRSQKRKKHCGSLFCPLTAMQSFPPSGWKRTLGTPPTRRSAALC